MMVVLFQYLRKAKDVQRPGGRGGRFYVTPVGRIKYGEKPSVSATKPPAAMAKAIAKAEAANA